MPEIRFARRYLKLPPHLKNGSHVTLLLALPVRTEQLSASFITFDTAFGVPAIQNDSVVGFYPLDSAKYLFLLFKFVYDNKHQFCFTTLRKDNKENRAKYLKNLNGIFEVVLE